MAILQVEGLSVAFDAPAGPLPAITDVTLAAEEGTILGIVGETGSGKSVTVRSIIRLLRPPGRVTQGRILLDGVDILRLSHTEMRRVRGAKLGMVAQNPFGALNPVLPIARQFQNIMRAHGSGSREQARSRALEALSAVRIDHAEQVMRGYSHQLSGGMAQRVVIAMAMLLNPRLIIADEPTTALDLTTQRQILDLIRESIITEQRAVILVTHDMGVVAQYCDQVAVMYAGRIVERGDVKDVLVDPRHPYTRALLNTIPVPGREIVAIEGTAPSLSDMPGGCPFSPRCERATVLCDSSMPLRSQPSERREVRCFYPLSRAV